MLRVSKLRDADYVLRDIAGGIEDYYLGRGEAPGVWAGRLAEEFGLSGVVEAEALRALIDGRDPTLGTPLVRVDRKRKVRAFDVTLSPPKSASLLWAFGTPEVSSVVSIAHVEAAAAALAVLDERAGVTRQQQGGVRRRVDTSGLAMATFVHRTSREGDPQLHSHCVIPNVVQRRDGAWVAIDATPLYEWAKAAGSIYQEELRRRLSEQLGVGWGPDRHGCREMLGFTEQQLERFSKRTGQIDHHLAAEGIEPAGAKVRMMADERAAVATRRPKDRSLTPQRLQQRWQREAKQVGLATGRRLERHLRDAGRQQHWEITAEDVGRLFELLIDPEVGLCAHDSRFGEPQLIARVAAFGGGRLTPEQIQRIAELFLQSDRVVRLIDRDPTGRTPPRWSTVAHRRLEDRVLANLSRLRHRRASPLDRALVGQVLAEHPHLGDDQRQAVRVLSGSGPAVRAVIAPPGYGKTTMLHAGAEAARRSGRPVVALATTNQAVAELQEAGLDAQTVARFALDGCLLPEDSVVVVDELSQLPTTEADLVLSAVAGCQRGQLWLIGDPLQAQPVRAAGLAPLIASLAERGRIPSATLTTNRRQADEIERRALVAYRDGDIAASQQLRQAGGLEHHAASPERARHEMADAVVEAIGRHRPEEVAALAVTHADCEDLADRIRVGLTEQGAITGGGIDGPGWTRRRRYQAGDRILLQAHLDLEHDHRLTNGTAATVVSVDRAGLTVWPDGHGEPALIPREFVESRGRDGRPQLSHAWCRTIDGVQGGTWAEVHLLGTAALDRYRGYVGQSRAVVGTHTWNTRALDPGDHGGRLVHAGDSPTAEVEAALERKPAKTFAALDDPYRLAGRLERERDAHRSVLARRPPDVTGQLNKARDALAGAQAELARAEPQLAECQQQAEAGSRFGQLRPSGRQQRSEAERTLRSMDRDVVDCRDRVERCGHALTSLEAKHGEVRGFGHLHDWRHQRVGELDEQLDRHWADVVLAAARAGDPFAYGRNRLEGAYRTIAARNRSNVGDHTAERDLTDLERAVLTTRQAITNRSVPVHEKVLAVRTPGDWPDLGRDQARERERGRDLGIGPSPSPG